MRQSARPANKLSWQRSHLGYKVLSWCPANTLYLSAFLYQRQQGLSGSDWISLYTGRRPCSRLVAESRMKHILTSGHLEIVFRRLACLRTSPDFCVMPKRKSFHMPNMRRFLFFAVLEFELIAQTSKYLVIQDTLVEKQANPWRQSPETWIRPPVCSNNWEASLFSIFIVDATFVAPVICCILRFLAYLCIIT